jgi:hypothetical protein
MKTTTRYSMIGLFGLIALSAGLALGCDGGAAEREDAKEKDKVKDKDKPVETKKVNFGKNIWLEVETKSKKRRVLVSAEVCLREGQLELLMCRKQTKEHEAILTADVDARQIHLALTGIGALEGSPVQFAPRYQAATGSKIKVSVQYKNKDGKLVTVPAQSWVKNMKTGKALDSDWVFAGSRILKNPLDNDKPHYMANDGDVICVSNFEGAMLDLPIKSSKAAADLIFNAFTERIPPLETKVVVILEPVPGFKKDKK